MIQQPFLDSAKRCCENGLRLLNEAELLEFERPPATLYYLSVIAQEEFAKAFLLYLVSIDVIPWSPLLLRATRNHECKQLVGVVVDHLFPDTDEFLRRVDSSIVKKKWSGLPASVADAMNILRHEKIGRWESHSWCWAEDPDYDNTAVNVSKGKRDKEKQRALYVELAKTGDVGATPEQVSELRARDEYERGRRFEQCISAFVDGQAGGGWDWEHVKNGFRALFSEAGSFLELRPS